VDLNAFIRSFSERAGTAMFTHTIAVGVIEGWLAR
jgi:hypothetical protein